MTQITINGGKIVFRDGKVGTGNACCCGTPGCCGIPKNCTVTVSSGTDWVYDHTTGLWTDALGVAGSWGILLGDCRGADGDLGDEYASCCIWFYNAGTPGIANPEDPCKILSAYLVGRVVCDSCCHAEPEFFGDTDKYGVNCRIEGVAKRFSQWGDCSAQKAAVNFDDWDITIACDPAPDPCNPLP